MKRLKHTLLLTVLLLCAFACDDSQKVLTQQEKESNAFIKKLAKSGEYTPYRFLNEDYMIYYKEIKNAPEENRDRRPYQNSRVRVRIEMRNAQTDQILATSHEQTLSIFSTAKNARNITRGLQIALQLMEVGDEWLVIIPWQLGFGSYSYLRDIPPYTNLKYHITLLEVIS